MISTITNQEVYILSESQLESYMKTARKCEKYNKIRKRNDFIKDTLITLGVGVTVLTLFFGTLAYFISCVEPM